jgi:Tol biopolymer transport system component
MTTLCARVPRPLATIVAALTMLAWPLDVAHAQFPGRNGVIAYTLAGEGTLETIPPTGGAGTPIPGSEQNDHRADYSPDGSRIAFVRNVDIWVMDADGTDVRQITANRAMEDCPSWSPDGSTLVFSRGGDLWVTDVTNPDPHRLVRSPRISENCPSWSPDGSTIAYARDAILQNWDIATMNADGSNRRRLTRDHPRAQYSPDWSPDGSKILFIDDGPGDSPSLMTIRPTGRALQLVLDGSRRGVWWPVYSPNGRRIAFTRFWDHRANVWMVRSDGTDLERLTSGLGYRFYPAWQPLPEP